MEGGDKAIAGGHGAGGEEGHEGHEELEEEDEEYGLTLQNPAAASAAAAGAAAEEAFDDPELEALRRKVKQMQEEAEALDKIQQQVEAAGPAALRKGAGGVAGGAAAAGGDASAAAAAAARNDKDTRSVYVGNVDYGATPEELQAHFASCGTIDRITILCDKWTGKPRGYAYVMFVSPDSVANALLLNETTLRGRQIKVTAKRTNFPGGSLTAPRRGVARGYAPPPYAYGGFAPRRRARRRTYYSPY